MIQFVSRSKKNPADQTTRFYPQMAPTTPLKLEDVIVQIERQCTVSAPDVKAVLNALEYVIVGALKNGTSVRLGDLGSFRPTIHSFGVATAPEVNAALIRRVRCRFTPSSWINRQLALRNVQFQPFRLPVSKGGIGGEGI